MSALRTLGGWQADYAPCPTCLALVREPHGLDWCRAMLAGKPGPNAWLDFDKGAKVDIANGDS